MITKKLRSLLCACLIMSVLCGCQFASQEQLGSTVGEGAPNKDVSGSAAESTVYPTATPLTPGTLETELIGVLPWDSSRTELSSGYFVAETETGIYFEYGAMLYYADRSDLSNWVVVCPAPDCTHKIGDISDKPDADQCNAFISSSYLLKEGRIYYPTAKSIDPKYWDAVPGVDTPFVASMAPDGSDRRVEHIFSTPEGVTRSGSGGGSVMIDGQNFISAELSLNENGLYDSWVAVVDEDGEYILFAEELEDWAGYLMSWRSFEYVYGDTTIYCQMMDPETSKAFRIQDRELTSVDISGLPYTGAYLSGNTMWVFRPGDGYYSVDLTTREEVWLADCQLETSVAHIMQPNCILESTLVGWNSPSIRADVEAHSLHFFDGKQWHDIAIPEELQNMTESEYLEPMALASDRILFAFAKGTGVDREQFVYQILLGTDEPVLELLGKLG